MNIYKIYQNVNRDYDTFSSAIVVANSEEEAKTIHPIRTWNIKDDWSSRTWAPSPEWVKCEYVGIADEGYEEPEIILASFISG